MNMKNTILTTLLFVIFTLPSMAQEDKKLMEVKPITRKVAGEIIMFDGDTLTGKIKVKSAQQYYITSIWFDEKLDIREGLTAYNVKKFYQVVPFPFREEYGVDTVYYVSMIHPNSPNKKVFLRVKKEDYY